MKGTQLLNDLAVAPALDGPGPEILDPACPLVFLTVEYVALFAVPTLEVLNSVVFFTSAESVVLVAAPAIEELDSRLALLFQWCYLLLSNLSL